MNRRSWTPADDYTELFENLEALDALVERADKSGAHIRTMHEFSGYLKSTMSAVKMLADNWKRHPMTYRADVAERIIKTLTPVIEVLKGKWA